MYKTKGLVDLSKTTIHNLRKIIRETKHKSTHYVRFIKNRQCIYINTGQLCSKGCNVIYMPHYTFTLPVIKALASTLDCNYILAD